jgi:hypothetical protein
VNATPLAHAALIHIRNNFANGFLNRLDTTLTVASYGVAALNDGVSAPEFAGAFNGRGDRLDVAHRKRRGTAFTCCYSV